MIHGCKSAPTRTSSQRGKVLDAKPIRNILDHLDTCSTSSKNVAGCPLQLKVQEFKKFLRESRLLHEIRSKERAGGKLMSAWPGADAWMCQSQPLDGSVDTSHAMLDVLFRKRNWDFFFIL